jgi:uncharacterized protein (DUF2062 family)
VPKKLFRRFMPDPHRIRKHRLLTWLGPWLHHPRLWHVSREGIARGAAIGGFFGLLVPIGQIPLSAVAAIALRANLPMAVATTFITNPFTFAPIYYFAYTLGLMLTGADSTATVVPASLAPHIQEGAGWLRSWVEHIVGLGKPLFVGLFVLACGFSLVSYFSINILWRLLTVRAWQGRFTRRAAARAADKSQ